MKKRAVSFILVLIACFGMVPASATEGANNIENEPVLVLSQASKDFMTRMFEKDGYTIARDDGTDVTEAFYADMTIEFEQRNFDAISDYLVNNNLTVRGPAELIDIDGPMPGARLSSLKGKSFHEEGSCVLDNTMGPGAQRFVWILDSIITYDDEMGRFVNAVGPEMQYAPWYELYDEYNYIENQSKTGHTVSKTSINFYFETEVFAYDYHDEGWVSRFHGTLNDQYTLTYDKFIEG